MPANFCQIGGLLLLLCTCGSPLILPTGLVSLLHYIYSRIPVINKGTDSRLGVGFRFGPHADLQFLVELGPQQLTRSLGDPQNPAPCCGFEDQPDLQDVTNQLTVQLQSSPGSPVRSPSTRSSSARNSPVRNSPGRNSPGRNSPVHNSPGRRTEANSVGSAADWLGRWQAGITGRGTRSHQEKTDNVGPPKEASTPRSRPLLNALHRFRDLWGAGQRAATAH